MRRLRVKICCIRSVAEAEMAIRYGASALGFVSAMPSGAGIISEERIAEIVPRVPPPIASFLLTSRTAAADVVEQVRRCGANTVQLVDRLERGSAADIRAALPGVRVVQVVHVLNEASVEEALAVAEEADGLLLDSGNPNLAVKELGGTGRVHDWRLSRRICESSPVPVFLAGGLNPGNVRAAVEAVEPFGVDVCSGLRIGGKELDEAKLAAFFEALPG